MSEILKKKAMPYLIPAFLGFVVLLLYSMSLSYGFIWDDFTYILTSPILSDPMGLVKIWMTRSTADFWPLSYSVLWCLKQLMGTNAFGYHAFNLFLYLLSVVLVYKVLLALRFKAAFWVALLYAVHPVNVEVAVWIFQIKTNLANVFGLVACLFWIKFVDGWVARPDRSENRYACYLLAALFMVLSFLSKISLVMLPVLFLLYFHVKNTKQSFAKSLLATAPFFALSLAFGLINIFWDRSSFPTVPSELILEESFLFRLGLVGHTYFFYFLKTFWPDPLTLVHPRFNLNVQNLMLFIPSLCVLITIMFGLSVTLQRKMFNFRKQFAVGLMFAFIVLLPVLGFFEIYFMRYSFVAEHWLTLALLGFLAPTVEFLWTSKTNKKVVSLFLSTAVLIFFYLSFGHMQNFSSEKKLLQQNLQLNPDSIMAYNTLALVLKADGDLDAARLNIEKAIAVKPNAQSFYNLAKIDLELGKMDEAKLNFEKAIELNPYFSDSYNNLATVYIGMRQFQEAIVQLGQALKIEAKNALALYNLGYCYEQLNLRAKALTYYKLALALQPTNLTMQQAVFELEK